MEMSYIFAPNNPNMNDDNQPMYHYFVTLAHNGKLFDLYYSVGIGHSKLFSDSTLFKRIMRDTPICNTIQSKYRGNVHAFPWYLNYDKPFFAEVFEKGRKFLPALKIEDVLECLVSDTQTVLDSPTFEEWANEFGYDTDSRKALKTFEVIREQGNKFLAFCGREYFNDLLEKIEELNQ